MMSMIDTVSFLRRFGVQVTRNRREILLVFLQHRRMLTQRDIQQLSGKKYNRVSLYRTLDVFVQSAIIRIVPSTDNVIRYVMSDNEAEKRPVSEHRCFTCNRCGLTLPFEIDFRLSPKLLEGCELLSVDIIAGGICRNCKLDKATGKLVMANKRKRKGSASGCR